MSPTEAVALVYGEIRKAAYANRRVCMCRLDKISADDLNKVVALLHAGGYTVRKHKHGVEVRW